MSTLKCNICGTITGQHGFSFDSKDSFRIMIPEILDLYEHSDEENDEFVAKILEACKKAIKS